MQVDKPHTSTSSLDITAVISTATLTLVQCLWDALRTIPYVSLLASGLAFAGWVITMTFWSPFMQGVEAFGFSFQEFEIYAMFFCNFYLGLSLFNAATSLLTAGYIAERCCASGHSGSGACLRQAIGEWLQLAFVVLSIVGSAVCFIMVLVGVILWTCALINAQLCSGTRGGSAPVPEVVSLWESSFRAVRWPTEFLNSHAAEGAHPCAFNSRAGYSPFWFRPGDWSPWPTDAATGDEIDLAALQRLSADVPPFPTVVQCIVTGFACIMASQVVLLVHAACSFIDIFDNREYKKTDGDLSGSESLRKPLADQEVFSVAAANAVDANGFP
jgi:hypothetical protein